MKVIAKEKKSGTCAICKEEVYLMAFVRKEANYFYTCLDCLNKGKSKRETFKYTVEVVDEVKLAREELVSILITLAEEDELLFKDARLSIIHTFKEDIIEGNISERLDNYVQFNGNNIREVLKIRNYALKCINKEGQKYKDLIHLYIQSRIRKWTVEDRNNISILLCDEEIQRLNENLFEHISEIENELNKDYSHKKYENRDSIQQILEFYNEKGYITSGQLQRLHNFHNEMLRRRK